MMMLNRWGAEGDKGVPTSMIHFLPIELAAFLDICWHLFLNRHGGAHMFWTGTASLMNLKWVIERALNSRDEQFLTKVISQLKADKVSDLIIEVCNMYQNEERFIPLDFLYIRELGNKLEAPALLKPTRHVGLSQIIYCTTFMMRYTLAGFKGVDVFKDRAKVLFREPPMSVFHCAENRWSARYQTGQNEESLQNSEIAMPVLEDVNLCPVPTAPTQGSETENVPPRGSKIAKTAKDTFTVEPEKSKNADKNSDQPSLQELEAIDLACNEVLGAFDLSEAPEFEFEFCNGTPIQPADPQPANPEVPDERDASQPTLPTVNSTGSTRSIHFHFHLNSGCKEINLSGFKYNFKSE